jgi:hypothetical protein
LRGAFDGARAGPGTDVPRSIWERIMLTVGGGAIATSALTRAIRDFGEQAKKQLNETGRLAGFEGKFTDESSSGGPVSISISALGAAAYDASASKDDVLLAYTLDAGTDGGSGGTGSSTVIRGDQDIDTFIAGFQGTVKDLHFSSYLYGTPEELAAASGGASEADASTTRTDAGGKTSDGAPSRLFAKLQQQQTASNRLIDFLQSYLNGLSAASKREGAPAGAGGSQENATQARLAQFTGTDVTA